MFNILITFNEKIKDFEMNLKKDVCVTLQNAEFGVKTSFNRKTYRHLHPPATLFSAPCKYPAGLRSVTVEII